MRHLTAIGIVFGALTACGLKGGGDPCSSDAECESGCCKAANEECSYPDLDYGVALTCLGTSTADVCCRFEQKSTFSGGGNSTSTDWKWRCECWHSSCAEVKGSTECSGGSCSSTLVRSVSQVNSCG